MLFEDIATKQNLRGRNAPPFDFSKPWLFWLGGDALGRPLLARIIVAAQNTIMVASGAVHLLVRHRHHPRSDRRLHVEAREPGDHAARRRHHVLSLAPARGDRALHAAALRC